ncbi:MAG: metallophosphoesterase [Chitinophagales bacterium]
MELNDTSKNSKVSLIHLTDFHFRISETPCEEEIESIRAFYEGLYFSIVDYIDKNDEINTFYVLLTGDFYDRNIKPKRKECNFIHDFILLLKQTPKVVIYACAGNHDICSESKEKCSCSPKECNDDECNCDKRNPEIIELRLYLESLLSKKLVTYGELTEPTDSKEKIKFEKEILKAYSDIYNSNDEKKIKPIFTKFFSKFIPDIDKLDLLNLRISFIKEITSYLKNHKDLQIKIESIISKYIYVEEFKVYNDNVLKNGLSHKKYLDLCCTSKIDEYTNIEGDSYLRGNTLPVIIEDDIKINFFSIDTSILSSLGDYLNYKHIIPKLPKELSNINKKEVNILIFHHPLDYWWIPNDINHSSTSSDYNKIVIQDVMNKISDRGMTHIEDSLFNLGLCGHIHKNNFMPSKINNKDTITPVTSKPNLEKTFPETTKRNIIISGYLDYNFKKKPNTNYFEDLSFNIIEITAKNNAEISYSYVFNNYNPIKNRFKPHDQKSFFGSSLINN